MLIEFRVKNFKNFADELVFKLDEVKNYEFSSEAIRDGVIKTSLVYGPNGSGKSNLGIAIMDISATLTDNEKGLSDQRKPFANLLGNGNVEFYYKFKFDKDIVVYRYSKKNKEDLNYEEMFINDECVIRYDQNKVSGEVYLKGAEKLKIIDVSNSTKSFVKYVKSNAVLEKTMQNDAFEKFIDFVERMLLFYSLEGNRYQGFMTGNSSLSDKIVEMNKISELEVFLKKAGLDYDLLAKKIDGEQKIYCKFGENEVDIFSIASRGTCSLILLFCWLLEMDKVSFVYIDEFDAFYHNKLAKLVVREVLNKNTQAVLTTHNTSVMNNDLLRPDCYYNLKDNKILPLWKLTKKELRKAHNLEKMYKSGSFDE